MVDGMCLKLPLIIIYVMWGIMNIACLNGNGLRDIKKVERVIEILKADVICFQETHWSEEMMESVKNVWKEDIFVNHGNNKERGVAILIKREKVKHVNQVFNDGKGRLLALDFLFYNEPFRLINVYAPNVEIERKELFKMLKPVCKGKCIVVGDFNVWRSRLDASSSAKFRSDASRKYLNDWMQNDDMVDAWREENPFKREFSRRQMARGILKQSRIDLCLVKREMSSYVRNVAYRFLEVSDHAAMKIKLCLNKEGRGGGVWCLNSSILSEEAYKENIRKCIQYEMENPLYNENVGAWWESLKEKIKKRSIRYSKQRNFMRKSKLEEMQKKMRREAEKIDVNPEYGNEGFLKIKEEIEEYEKEKSEGAKVRSRAQYALEGERSTKFFLNLEKSKQKRCFIMELENENGEKVTDLVGIIEAVQKFYEKLFKKEGVKQECVDVILDSLEARLEEDEREMCDKEICEEEIEEAIKQAKPNKSPGSDGLTHEFYKTFREFLAPILCKLYKHMEERREMPESMGLGMITILYKNKGSKMKLENYRPLSLLNTDYKILTKVLANRIKGVVGGIISESQAYSIPGRDIVDTVCTIRDVVESMGRDGEGGMILCMDLNKAFDRVEHSFIVQVMRRFGFGKKMVDWIKLVYGNARSCVKINGVLTKSFKLERSVRQGCPLSALLYSITAEPLAMVVKSDERIRGIQIPNGGVSKIHQYADDTTFTVKDMDSINRIRKHMETYGKASGAKVNIEKSEIMSIGGVNVEGRDIPFKIAKEYMKILGINIGVNDKEARDATWTGILNKIKQVLQFWKLRELGLGGKVVVVNSLILTKCNYVIGAIDMPDWVLNDLKETVSTFLWGGKGVLISAKTLIADNKEGGLNLIDVNVKRKAIRFKVIKKFLYDKVDYGWKGFMKEFLSKSSGCGEEGIFMALKSTMIENVPPFYKEVFCAWAELLQNVEYECQNINQIHKQPIFLNTKIRMKRRMFYNRLYMKAGIRQVKDIVYEYVGGFLPNRAVYDSVVEWDDEIGESQVDTMCENIKISLPKSWVERIQEETVKPGYWGMPEMYIVINGKEKSLSDVTTKMVYKILLKKELKGPASEAVWSKLFPGFDVKTIWKNLSVKYNAIECENLDFKLRHNRIYTKMVIHQINREENRECDVCLTDVETLMHMFFECKKLDIFHDKLKNFFKNDFGKDVKEEEWKKLFLFGECVNKKDMRGNLCNFILSNARYAIWIRRNLAFHEGRIVDVNGIFRSVMRKNVYSMWKYLVKEEFEKAFTSDCRLICIKEKKELSINF